ncbi:hypothetical protein Tco_1170028 [Tanacetum coccineum]
MIRLHALHRRSAGINALVVLQDTRWEDSRQIIATMEVDLSAGTQLVYTSPDMILSVNDFHNHVEVAIRTHGMENVVDRLTKAGITAIPGERRSIEELNRSVSLRFERYRQTPQPPRYSVDQHDREVIRNDNLDKDEEHFIGICLQTSQEEHISYDVCFYENCLNEARILEEEPLNKVRRSNKPKQLRQRSWERWSTLGEPSRKWDYYVKNDAPPNTTPIEEIAATGWGDEFSDDEVTSGKIPTTIGRTSCHTKARIRVRMGKPIRSKACNALGNIFRCDPFLGIDSILNPNTESTSLVDVPVTTHDEIPPSFVTTLPPPPIPLIQPLQQTPVSTTTIVPSTSLQNFLNFGSLLEFKDRVKSLEDDFSEFKQTNPFAKAVSSILGIVDKYLANQMNEAVKEAVQLQSDRLREEA